MPDPDLRRLAAAATPGPWRFDPFQMANGSHGAMAAGAGPAIVTGTGTGRDADKDAAYIAAASPDRVLVLLDRLAALEGALRRLVDEYDEDMRRSPSFVSIEEARGALAGTPKP